MKEDPQSRSVRSVAGRWLRRTGAGLGACLLFYAGFLLLGFVPVNRDYVRPAADDRVGLLIRTNEIHTDLVLPVVDEATGTDWRALFPPAHFAGDVRSDRYVAVGWGDRGFYVETPRWSDMQVATAANALLVPSESVLHVEYLRDAAAGDHFREVFVSRQQYGELVRFVRESLAEVSAEGEAVPLGDASYGSFDRFYRARGKYHLFNSCNQWTGRGLRRAGVPVGMWTPLKQQVLVWLPEEEPKEF